MCGPGHVCGKWWSAVLIVALMGALIGAAWAHEGEEAGEAEEAEPSVEDIQQLKLRDWQPRSMMVTDVTEVDKPKYPAVDVHNHLGGGDGLTEERVEHYLREMDAAGVQTVVNLDGGWGERLEVTLERLDEAHPGRFLTYALIDFRGIDDEDWGEREAERLEESFKAGAKGLKVHKSLGLYHRYADGSLMPVDDPKLDPIWEVCAEYDRPVVIHSADPAAFFTPLDRFNERWHELNEHPGWLFYGDQWPPRDEILQQRNRVIERHPETTFICAHMANNPEDLDTVSDWLDRYPNMYVDIDARISELGRQPYSARRFLIKHQDRVMFGTDTTPRREAFRIYYRFLETDDEYFDSAASHHQQGFWNIYAVFLPDEVLERIYRTNAERVLYGLGGDAAAAGAAIRPRTTVKRTQDFDVEQPGRHEAWEQAGWVTINKHGSNGPADYATRMKLLYSDAGLYVLMDGEDAAITSDGRPDFSELWKQDVYELFLWPNMDHPVYFEYEISPHNKELPLLLTKIDGRQQAWRPWQYEGDRRVRKQAHVSRDGDAVRGWSAEIFVPWSLIEPLGNVPPSRGDVWRANFYRMDYDGGEVTAWAWSPVGPSFHELENFGTIVFE